jgi:hypothetical protein
MSGFLDAWFHHWGWAWMIVGLLGCVVIMITFDN